MPDKRLRTEAPLTRWQRMLAWDITATVIIYMAIVLGVDLLASLHVQWPINWNAFAWRPASFHWIAAGVVNSLGLPPGLANWLLSKYIQSFDVYKFLFWFVIPVIASWKHMDWGYWRTVRWKRIDIWILLALSGAGLVAVFAIDYIPVLSDYYRDQSDLPFDKKMAILGSNLLWIVSWLPGWEFLHRYALLRRMKIQSNTFGWLLVPFSETLYHIVKPWPETIAMAVFSLILTYWAKTRRNFALPFWAHLIIEIELVLVLLWA